MQCRRNLCAISLAALYLMLAATTLWAVPGVVWVDDDYTSGGYNDGHTWLYDAFDQIQPAVNAVDAGGTVNVAAGLYAEQVIINKSVSIVGSGNPVLNPPATPLATFTLAENPAVFEPIVFAYGGTDDGSGSISGSATIEITFSGFEIDGNNAGAVNRFTAILLRNCRNSIVEGNRIYEMLYSSGLPMTFGILAYGDSHVGIRQNVINDFTRGGIGVNGDDGPLPDPTGIIESNQVIGEGVLPQGNWAQNGIMIGYGAAGSIIGNEVYDIAILDPSWSASGLIIYYPAADVIVRGNNVHDCQGALNAYFADRLKVIGNIFNQNEFEFVWGGNGDTISGNTFTANDQALYLADVTIGIIDNNTISGNSYGVIMDGSCDNIWSTGNSIIGNSTCGIAVAPYGGYSPTNISFQFNNISGNTFGLENTTTNTINATGNWWGDISGPAVTTKKLSVAAPRRPSPVDYFNAPLTPEVMDAAVADRQYPDEELSAAFGSGDPVTALVDYSPWWSANYVGDPHTLPWKWYLNNSYSSSLQEAADLMQNGDSTIVLNGLYNWTLNIVGRTGLTFIGENTQNTIIQFDGTLSWDVGSYGSSRQTAVRVVNCDGITFDSLTFDFNLIKGNNISGILYWNSGGTIANSLLENMNIPDLLGGYYELMCYLRAPNFTAQNRAQVNFRNNQFIKTGRVGIIAHDYVNVLIEGNSFDKVDDDFGYAMEIGSMSTGVIRGNNFTNYDTWALSDQSASGAIYVENSFTQGIGPVAKPVVIEDNEISFCQFGIHIGNEFVGYTGDVDIQIDMSNNIIRDCQTSGSQSSGGIKIADEGRNLGSSVTIVMDNNLIHDNSDYGVYIYTLGNGEIDATLTNNTVYNHYQGVIVKNFGASTGSLYNLSIHHNYFQNNLNAENDAVPGFWDDGTAVGNCWSDFNLNSGYPSQYNIPGVAAAVDRYPNADCGALCDCQTGNANGIASYNILDATYLINYLYKSGANPVPYEYCSGDANCNCQVNILDVTYLLNYLYKSGTPPCQCYQWAAQCGLPLQSGMNGDSDPGIEKAMETMTTPLTAYR
ncbi:MAG: right-handed parallel beta-helix repeat-containing protein [Candidatus Zixiibacteriota bacterium]